MKNIQSHVFPPPCTSVEGGEMAGDDLDAIVTSIRAKRGRKGKGFLGSFRFEGEPDQISIWKLNFLLHPSLLPSFLPLLLCGSEYLCIRGGDRSTGRGKRDRGISLIWGTSGLGASLDTYFSDHTPLLLASFGLHSYLNANIISTPI